MSELNTLDSFYFNQYCDISKLNFHYRVLHGLSSVNTGTVIAMYA